MPVVQPSIEASNHGRRVPLHEDSTHDLDPVQRDYRSVNALAESIIGLFKTEVVNRHRPFKTLTEVGFALMQWCDW
ncbi:hypothetical protein ACRS5S_03660 [Nocardia asiatica]|uniref:hypothetical protein n=1 Tax=Nocardia asiatica TaxID=209252 RepID=UPI003EE0E611